MTSAPRQHFVDQIRATLTHGDTLQLFANPAVNMRFSVVGDEVRYRTETDHHVPGDWHPVPPGGVQVIGLTFVLLSIDTAARKAQVQVGTTEEARAWHIKTIRAMYNGGSDGR